MKTLKLLCLSILMMSILVPGVFAAATDITFNGYTWFRETGNNKVFGDGQTNTAKASIERTYLRWKLKYEDNVEGNITLDIPMKAGNTSNSDWTTLVKYAYVDLTNSLPEGGFMRIGLQPVYFAMLDKWEYPLIYKPLEDNLGLLSSADLGFSVQGFLPGGWADYQIAGFGGNGYAKPTDTDNNVATDISLGIYPVPGLSIRGSIYNSQVATGDYYAKENVVTGKYYNGVAVNYNIGQVWLMWEGVDGFRPAAINTATTTKYDSYHVSGTSKMVMWTPNDRWDVGVREDTFNPDVDNNYYTDLGLTNSGDIRTSAQDMMIYGVNYHWAEDVLFQLNYSKLTYTDVNQNAGANPFSPGNARYTQYESVFQVKWSY